MKEHDYPHTGFLPFNDVAGVMQINAIIPGVTGNAVRMDTVSIQKGVAIAVQQGEF